MKLNFTYKIFILFPALILITSAAFAQFTISGRVTDDKGKPVRGASVSLENTLDGTTSDSLGNFSFTTTEKGNQTIVATEVSHDNAGQPLNIAGDINNILIKMKGHAHELNAVTITAGSFEASNDKDKTVLKPLDIVTTAGAGADVVKAMKTLPGTQHEGTENGLFVRGGDASEAAILVDEMVVQNAFFNSAPGVVSRSRFGAFSYKGVSFSSGGYSARYDQALSGILELNSLDLADKSTVNLGVNMAGIYAAGTKLWKNSSLDIGGSYNNLTPFYGLATTNVDYYKVPVGGSGNLRYVWKPNKDGILKVSMNTSFFKSGVAVPNPFSADSTIDFNLNDNYYYSNVSYKQTFKNKFSLYTAASYSYDNADNKWGDYPVGEIDQRLQYRIEGTWYFNPRTRLLLGSDIQHFDINKKSFALTFDTLNQSTFNSVNQSFAETQTSGYTELDWAPVYWLAIRPGIRYENSALLNKSVLAPRLSMAIKTGDNSQVSLATGIFYQDANNSYLLYGYRPDFQKAIHYIANWQWVKDDRTLRIEAYYKDYKDLVRDFPDSTHMNTYYDPNGYRNLSGLVVDNSGYGYAKGLELFWRDKKSVKNMDYWISYSYIDTRRLYKNFISEATPEFISDHNLNLIWKYFIDKWQTNISVTYSYASGRPYYNPNNSTTDFLTTRTPDYNNLALTLAYLHTFGKWFSVFYLGIDNLTNAHNIFGYAYPYDFSHNPPTIGNPVPVLPALYRSMFFGVNFSLTKFSKDEL
jgi:hypothetical protein